MSIISGEDCLKFLENMVYEKTQVQKYGVDLTVKDIYVLENPGSMDFGGSELEIADKRRSILEKRDPADKYAWWNLQPGDYLLEYNEKLNLQEGMIALLQPKQELMRNGSHHPPLILTHEDQLQTIILSVGSSGINIKQNARVSRLIIFDKI